MTEAEWLQSTDIQAMLTFRPGNSAQRKRLREMMIDPDQGEPTPTVGFVPSEPLRGKSALWFTTFKIRNEADLVRCVIPYHQRFRVSPAWLTETVVLLARGIRQEEAFDRLPILADALEDAGCSDVVALGHCRNDLHHDSGCWVVDAVLGKE